ncbi:FAD-dependent oxidoreductase [Lactobacillus sp. ESL0731]|uniref:FAD-dependent oxidoreductase n=1 Tax=unclassified Lactobacillus TaxID=2620435 RepID=UPI0023F6B6B8|nr:MULTISPECIES: FAD-dependent oxidoreductase [unclassified Lactobacillus]WEV50296.1 FAD-dependent oxidoreductase [Lactobacillus sp. ESL0700]WEV61425.1 FAD-dependent oxidoreductase [Lactobacillus sp. ESL0731]
MANLKDGTYQGTGSGNRGEVKVSVTVKNGAIAAVNVDQQEETAGISSAALKKAPELIIEHQSYNIDAVTGATITFTAVEKAVRDALSKAGDSSAFAKKVDLRTTTKTDDTQDYRYLDPATLNFEDEADVLIIGAGAAGLSAAISARQKGASVLCLEYTSSYMLSDMTLSGGYYNAGGGTSLQKQQGIEDTKENWDNYLKAVGQGYEDDGMREAIVEHGAEDYEWLASDVGVNFEEVQEIGNEQAMKAYAKPAARSHLTVEKSGYGLSKPLFEKAEAVGSKFIFNITAENLITDKNNCVIGVHTNKGNFKGKSIIVATAGFSRNKELLKSFAPDFAVGESYGSIRQMGDGITMGAEIGAKLRDMWMPIANSIGTQSGDNVCIGPLCTAWTKPYIWVGTDAKRHFREDMYFEFASKKIASLDQGYVWLLFDEGMANEMPAAFSAPAPSPHLKREVEDGYFKKADTIEDLAGQIGLDPQTLKQTITKWNQDVIKGSDSEFGRTKDLTAFKAPYYAAKLAPSTPDMAGGLAINPKAEVLDNLNKPIQNLYAAGSTTGGWRGMTYPGCGMGITNAVVFGRIAGTQAAENASEDTTSGASNN